MITKLFASEQSPEETTTTVSEQTPDWKRNLLVAGIAMLLVCVGVPGLFRFDAARQRQRLAEQEKEEQQRLVRENTERMERWVPTMLDGHHWTASAKLTDRYTGESRGSMLLSEAVTVEQNGYCELLIRTETHFDLPTSSAVGIKRCMINLIRLPEASAKFAENAKSIDQDDLHGEGPQSFRIDFENDPQVVCTDSGYSTLAGTIPAGVGHSFTITFSDLSEAEDTLAGLSSYVHRSCTDTLAEHARKIP